jgi:type IV secretory pathway VirB2 component (pilin)
VRRGTPRFPAQAEPYALPRVAKLKWGIPVELVIDMTRNTSVVLYILVLIAVVVGVDLLFFKNQFWERLIVNIVIVLVFAAFGLRFLKNP